MTKGHQVLVLSSYEEQMCLLRGLALPKVNRYQLKQLQQTCLISQKPPSKSAIQYARKHEISTTRLLLILSNVT